MSNMVRLGVVSSIFVRHSKSSTLGRSTLGRFYNIRHWVVQHWVVRHSVVRHSAVEPSKPCGSFFQLSQVDRKTRLI
jgi:hypothetical protein